MVKVDQDLTAGSNPQTAVAIRQESSSQEPGVERSQRMVSQDPVSDPLQSIDVVSGDDLTIGSFGDGGNYLWGALAWYNRKLLPSQR